MSELFDDGELEEDERLGEQLGETEDGVPTGASPGATEEEVKKWEKEQLEEKVDKATEYLYNAYGSGTGVLFGIPSDLRPAVRTIVKVMLSRKTSE